MKILAFFQNLKIRSKLAVGFASMIVFMTVIGYAGYTSVKDIKEKIESIQGTTSITVKDIDDIAKVIFDVNDVVSGIATAVEEQSAATSEIATNVTQASQGIQADG